MMIPKLRHIKRIKDREYLGYFVEHLADGRFLKRFLPVLARYHDNPNYDFSALKQQCLEKTLRYAYKNSKYYRQLFEKAGVRLDNLAADFRHIPFLDKNIIRNEKDNIYAFSGPRDYVGYFTTGGSTGQPLGFYTLGGRDPEHQEFLFTMMGYKPGNKILAMDGTVLPDELISQNVFWKKKNTTDLPYGRMALSSQYLSSKNIHLYIEFLNDFKPDIIRGYPSFIDEVANFILKNDIRLSFAPKGVELTSESYHDDQINNIKKAFNTKIFIQYGHAEASIFGYSVDDSLMIYCSPLYGHTEVIGEDERHVKPGEIGEVVVTGFYNYATPFIRYRTGDLAVFDGEDNGIVRFQKIYGRTQDYVYKRDMEKVLLTALVFGRHYKAFSHINKWQIIQDKPGEIVFRIIPDGNFSHDDETELAENFFKLAQIATKFEYTDEIALTPRGKSKFLIQNIADKR